MNLRNIIVMNVCLNIHFVGLFLALYCYRDVQGTAAISPPSVASVCSEDQLELMCNATGMFLEWNISQIDVETGVTRQFIRRSITADGPADIQTFPVQYNSIIFTFSRISLQGSPVLISKVVINSVKESLNGTVVTCVDVTSPRRESSSTTIVIINSQIQNPVVNISELFERQAVTVTLEWTQNAPQARDLYSYYISVTPLTPAPIAHLNETIILMVNMSYNAVYNVTILIKENRCMENITLISQSFYYPYCRDPSYQIDDTIKVDYNKDSAIAGSSVTFRCSLPGHILIGSNISICTSYGEWEPDPREATKCKVNCGPPSPPLNCLHITESYANTLEGAEVMFLCRSTIKFGQESLCMEVNITSICNKEGIWKPITDDFNSCAGLRGLSGSSLSQDGIIAIASSIFVFTVSSISFTLFGYLCRRKQEQKSSSSANKPPPIYESVQIMNNTEMVDVEINVAYLTVQH